MYASSAERLACSSSKSGAYGRGGSSYTPSAFGLGGGRSSPSVTTSGFFSMPYARRKAFSLSRAVRSFRSPIPRSCFRASSAAYFRPAPVAVQCRAVASSAAKARAPHIAFAPMPAAAPDMVLQKDVDRALPPYSFIARRYASSVSGDLPASIDSRTAFHASETDLRPPLYFSSSESRLP